MISFPSIPPDHWSDLNYLVRSRLLQELRPRVRGGPLDVQRMVARCPAWTQLQNPDGCVSAVLELDLMAKDRFNHSLPALPGCILAATLPVWRADLVRLLAQARAERRRSDQKQWQAVIASIDAMTVSLAEYGLAGVEQRVAAFLAHSKVIRPEEVLPYLELLPNVLTEQVKAEDWRRRLGGFRPESGRRDRPVGGQL